MRVKIVGDGSPRGTKVTNAATGELIHGIQKVVMELDANGANNLTLEMSHIPLDLELELTDVIIRDQRYVGDETYRELIWGEKFAYNIQTDHEYPCPICNAQEYDKQVREGKIKPFNIKG